MLPKLKILNLLLERARNIKQPCIGCLYGIFYDDQTLLVIGFNVESTIGELNYKQILNKFPAGVELCGMVKFGECAEADSYLNDILKDIDITDNPILIQFQLGSLVDLKISIYIHGKLHSLPYEVMDEKEVYENFYISRLQFQLNFCTQNNVQNFKSDINCLRTSLLSGRLVFQLAKSKVFLTHTESYESLSCSQKRIYDIVNMSFTTNGTDTYQSDNATKSKNKMGTNSKNYVLSKQHQIIYIEVLKDKTKQHENFKLHPCFLMQTIPSVENIHIPLEFDTIAIFYRFTKLSGLYDILISSVCRSLQLIEESILESFSKPEEKRIAFTKPKMYHFLPIDLGHMLTVVYLDNLSEDSSILHHTRKKLHLNLGLPINRPYFRRGNSYLFDNEIPHTPLINVHQGIKASGLINGKQYTVQGRYSYYHYMHENIDDKGWGCAYRSFQTLFSWFKWQGYSDLKIPSHYDLQQYLVKIGDKPKRFIGSSQWIGSTEVSLCLQGLLGVESKIIYCKNGPDISNVGSELVNHFQSQGTPVMIGGGVLAHTILGVDYNYVTSEIKFLILDPHFSGKDDINVIHGKGWCSWKGLEFWEQFSHYNICLPQRPIMY